MIVQCTSDSLLSNSDSDENKNETPTDEKIIKESGKTIAKFQSVKSVLNSK